MRRPISICRTIRSSKAEQAESLILSWMTAWQMLERLAQIPDRGRILVPGAAGAVGNALVQLARLRGIEVIATVAARDHDWLRGQGVGAVIDYGDPDLSQKNQIFGGNPWRRDEVLRLFQELGSTADRVVCLSKSGLRPHSGSYRLYSLGGRYDAAARRRICDTPAQQWPGVPVTEPGSDYPYQNQAIAAACASCRSVRVYVKLRATVDLDQDLPSATPKEGLCCA